MLKKMFVDIACFLVGSIKEKAIKLLETYYSHVDFKIDTLQKRCLLSMDDGNTLRMHDLLQKMGREVSRNNSPNEPGKYSRLWAVEDIYDVLKKHKGTEAIECIIHQNLGFQNPPKGISFTTETFKRMDNLRFLLLADVKITGSFEQILEDLRWLGWVGCPLESFPSKFCPQKLVFLALPCSKLKTMKGLNMVFINLKDLDISGSEDLTTTPDFRKFPRLETLNLEACKSLKEVHISIGILGKLVRLNLRDCVNIKSLPGTLCNLSALEVLKLDGCKSLEALPLELGKMESLKKLYTSGNENLRYLPDSICNLSALEVLQLDGCKSLEALPLELGKMESLKKLYMSGNENLINLPDSICNLSALEVLDLDGCKSLEALPLKLGKMESLKKLYTSGNENLRKLPDSICNLTALEVHKLDGCKRPEVLPLEWGEMEQPKVLYPSVNMYGNPKTYYVGKRFSECQWDLYGYYEEPACIIA